MSDSRAWSLGSRNLWLLQSLWFSLINFVHTVMSDLWKMKIWPCYGFDLKLWRFSRTLKKDFSSVQFSRSFVSDSLPPHESQHARTPCSLPTPGVYPNSCPSSWWCHPAISSSVSLSPPAPNPFQHQSLFQWVSSSHKVAKVLEFQLQHQSFQWTPRTHLPWDGLIGCPCSPRDSQESSPTLQFKISRRK